MPPKVSMEFVTGNQTFFVSSGVASSVNPDGENGQISVMLVVPDNISKVCRRMSVNTASPEGHSMRIVSAFVASPRPKFACNSFPLLKRSRR